MADEETYDVFAILSNEHPDPDLRRFHRVRVSRAEWTELAQGWDLMIQGIYEDREARAKGEEPKPYVLLHTEEPVDLSAYKLVLKDKEQ